MAQYIKTVVSTPEELSLITMTHRVEGGDRLLTSTSAVVRAHIRASIRLPSPHTNKKSDKNVKGKKEY